MASQQMTQAYDLSSQQMSKRKKGSGKAKRGEGKKKSKRLGPAVAKNAYNFYTKENRQAIREENPGLAFGELQKVMAEKWRSLDKDSKEPYLQRAARDRERYKREFQEWAAANPAEAEALKAEKKQKAKKGGEKKNPGEKKRVSTTTKTKTKLKRKREDGDDDAPHSEEEGGAGDEKETKKTSMFDEIWASMKQGKRKTKPEVPSQELEEMAQFFIKKMQNACDEDVTLNLNSKPATTKFKMLDEVINQVSKTGMQDRLMFHGLLRAIRGWLRPLPRDGSLPNVRIRTELYKLLDALNIGEQDLINSEGLGKQIMDLWANPKETKENRNFLHALIEKWCRPLFDLTTNYKRLAEYEQERAVEVAKRKAALGSQALYPKKRTVRTIIPEPAPFDYAIRPTSSLNDENNQERRATNKKEGPKARLVKKVDKRSGNPRLDALLIKVDLEGKHLIMGGH